MPRIVTQYREMLARQHRKPKSTAQKAVSLVFGALFFLAILPAAFYWCGERVARQFSIPLPRTLELTAAGIAIALGLGILLWAVGCFWRIGEGTPVPVAAPRKLVVLGPYRYCRNPIELAAIFYFFGVGAYFGSFTVGLVCFLLALTIGSGYHKFVEEKELEARFGEDYLRYKEETPFLVPRIFSCARRGAQR
jgi:protein-S-isoprenylcysteine O-methyltransferase Ste14